MSVTQLRSYVTVNVTELELVITFNFNNNNTIIIVRVHCFNLKINTYNIFQLLLFEIHLSIFWFIPNNN